MSCFRIDLLILSAIRTIHLCTKTNIDSTPFIEFSRCEENRLHVSCIIHILLSFVYENSSKIHKLLIFSLMCIPLNCNQTYYIVKNLYLQFFYTFHITVSLSNVAWLLHWNMVSTKLDVTDCQVAISLPFCNP